MSTYTGEYDIKIDYDDNILDIIDQINFHLESHGLMLDCDNKEHDGFELYRIIEV